MISFIIPAYNEERLLARTLTALHVAGLALDEPYELIVVDDGSTDATAAVARAHSARVVAVQFRQIGRTRNAGVHASSGDTLIFVDADTVVPPDTVRATLHALRRGVIGGGATIRFDGRLPAYARLLVPVSLAVLRAGRLAGGCYFFCTRAAFDAAGGFDDGLYAAEEIALSRRLKRIGHFVILREAVTTSGRKLRAHSGWDVVRMFGGFVRRGTSIVRSRDRLEIWYGDRREDL
ncbi:MAG: glycosyltransferase [Acidobacteria bacterium]|nr:glycosyltransferase [Acidobacteriota bacterium]MCA1648946.1 glycosyltransferase [Acidobacteriota bacterium]